MHYETSGIYKGLIILDISDLNLISQCPFSVTLANRFRNVGDCLRCNAFSEIARYCFKRCSKETNSISDKRLKERYERILCRESIGDELRGTMIRADSIHLSDIINLSKEYQNSIDNVEQEIVLNFGRFVIKDRLDAILCIQGQYYITKFMCDEHVANSTLPLSYHTIACSLWLRENYDINTSGVCFIQLRSRREPVMNYIDISLTTEQLRQSISSVITHLEPESPIKNKLDYKIYIQKQLARLHRSFGSHCWDCQEPTCIKP